MEINTIQNTDPRKPPLGKIIAILGVFLVVIFGVWYLSRGLFSSKGGMELGKNGTTTKSSLKKKAPETLELSYYNNWIKFIPGAAVKETYPEKEYIEIEAIQPNLSGADASGWVLENSQGERAALGKASTLPLSGKVNSTDSLKIKAGDRLVVSTGRSPIGVSFRVNKCSPYLEQFQDFIPPLSKECPYISSEKSFYSLDGKCQMFVQSLPRCEANTLTLPSGISETCKTFLNSTVNYNGCVATHKNDPDFYMKEWRVFLGKEKELWTQPKDTILLLDDKGKLIDTIKY